ncbi:MAG: hypothetical protein ACI4HQ_03020 [Acetatifactor sp.]
MAEQIINGFRIKMSRKRTHVTTYENMILQTTQPIKKDKQKKIKPSIPSDYAGFNYYNRMKRRRCTIREICENNFDLPYVVMVTLTFAEAKEDSAGKSYTNLSCSHYEFKKFIQRINSHYDNFKYIATFSRQGNGNWHYHVMCNFSSKVKKGEIESIWKNGSVYITYVKDRFMYEGVVEYLIQNMDEAATDLKKKRGYLCSDNIERDIVLDSWHASQEEEFNEAFEKVSNSSRRIMYETRNHLGVKGQTVNEDTGEIVEFHINDMELTPIMERAGYEKWETVYTHLTSAADFSEKFSPLLPATPKTKKWKQGKKEKTKAT